MGDMDDGTGGYTGAGPFLDAIPVEIRIHIFESILFENGNFFSLGDEEGKSVSTLFPKLRAPLKGRDQQRGPRGPRSVDGERKCRGNIMPLLLTSKKM
jgi:hypothetical protein